MRQPPGKEIYRKGTISVYEVDGKDHKVRYAVEFFSLSLISYVHTLLISYVQYCPHNETSIRCRNIVFFSVC